MPGKKRGPGCSGNAKSFGLGEGVVFMCVCVCAFAYCRTQRLKCCIENVYSHFFVKNFYEL